VLAAFAAAHERGADVQIVYHALDDGEGNANRAAIAAAGLPASILKPRTHATIAHDKFIVLCRKHQGTLTPVSVWTGSTNLSEGGIFGHSNVGHEVRDAEVADRYLDFWFELDQDPELTPLRDWVSEQSPYDPAAGGIKTVFSPRHGLAPLQDYATRFGSALVSAYITGPFGLNTLFENALTSYTGDALHYVMLDQVDNNQATWSASRRVFVAVGSEGGPDELSPWAAEQLTGFNVHVPYLHTKILLLDPTSAAPMVITGSANFSPASTDANDENMLIIPGDLDVADVYLTEYSRIFNHFLCALVGGAARAQRRRRRDAQLPRRDAGLAGSLLRRRQPETAPADALQLNGRRQRALASGRALLRRGRRRARPGSAPRRSVRPG
jgi:phosphatidylserine/phosphatidylglycerophosphate/cardiolipin synthase-like enzyme